MSVAGVTLGELAVRFGCQLRGNPQAVVRRVATLDAASADALCFLANPKYRKQLLTTQAGAVLVNAAAADECPVPTLITSNPYLMYARIAAFLHPAPLASAGIHPTAVIADTAQVDAAAQVGAHVVIGADSVIGARAVIQAGSILGNAVSIGADTLLMPNVTVRDGCQIGERCIINPSAVIGSEGFGFAPDAAGAWLKVPQLGSVRIGNDVEIGAGTTIDRGALGDTVIEDGVKLDNQIQIAHNVRVGAHTAIAAFVGVSGSTTIGRHCMIAGQVGIAGHLSICDGVVITGKTMVSTSIGKPGVYSGSLPMDEARKFRRNAARFAQLDQLAKQLRRLTGKPSTADDSDDHE